MFFFILHQNGLSNVVTVGFIVLYFLFFFCAIKIRVLENVFQSQFDCSNRLGPIGNIALVLIIKIYFIVQDKNVFKL